jgi:membrane-associated phospholipid phosphatase
MKERNRKRIMRRIKNNLIPLSLIILIIVINSIYGYLNTPLRGVHSLVTDLDRSIPFLSAFVIPYVIWYPFMLFIFVFLCFNQREIYYRVLVSLSIGMLISYSIYYFFQTTVPRPEIVGNGLLLNLVRLVYNTDNPFNCFPSIHVLSSFIIIKGISKSNVTKVFKYITYFIAILIILSTQFIKQHVIMDMIFAILLADGIYKTIDYLILSGGLLWIRKLSWLWTMKRKLET